MPQFLLTAGYTFADALDLHDFTNYFVEEKGYTVGPVDKDGHRSLTLKVFIQALTTDQLSQKEADLSWKLEQAERAYGPNGVGQPVIFWSKLGDNESWTYWTVIGGKISFKDVAASTERQIEANLTLSCLPEATSDPIPLSPSPSVDSTQPIFVPYVKGDCGALLKLLVTDTGVIPINKLWVSIRGHRNLRQGDFTSHYPTLGSLALTTDWQDLAHFSSPQGSFDSGLFDVVARINDTSRPLATITDLDGLLQPTGGLKGGFYEYGVTTSDVLGQESSVSNIFDITVPTGTTLVLDANPDPANLTWSGPIFLGGSCFNPGTFAVDGPGVCRSTSGGLLISCQSDGWILNNVISQPLLSSVTQKAHVSPTNKLPPKSGELGFSYTGLERAFPAPVTGQLTFQYDLDLQQLSMGPLASPIFFPQIAPFGLMRSPFGWAFYCSSASSSEDTATLVSDWKGGKLLYSLFSSSAFSAQKNTVTIACDWRNGPLTATLSVNGVQVAALEASKAGPPATDVYLGVVVTNAIPEFTFKRTLNLDLATWSYTKVQSENTSKSKSSSSGSSSGSNTSSSSSSSDSTSDSSNSSSSSGSSDGGQSSGNDSTGSDVSTNTSNSESESNTHTDSSAVVVGGSGSSTSSGSGDSSSNSSGTNSSTSNGQSGGDSSSSGSSTSTQSSHSTGTSSSSSTSTSTSDGSGNDNSTNSSTSTSTSDTTISDISFDIPKPSISRQVTPVGSVVTTSETTSFSTNNSASNSSNTSTSTSNSDSNSTSDSSSNSSNSSTSSSSSTSNSSSTNAGTNVSTNDSSSSGTTTDASQEATGANVTANDTSTSSTSSNSGSSNSSNTSHSSGTSASESTSTSTSSSTSASTSNSTSTSQSSSSSGSTSQSTSDNTSTSKSTQLVYLVQPLAETIVPDTEASFAFVSVLLSNVIVSDGPIGLGQAVLLNWTPAPANGQNQRLYRILNTGAGSPQNNWQYKVLGATDTSYLDSDPDGWTDGSPPDAFSGPQPALLRIGYAATPTDPLTFTPPIAANLSNGSPEFLKLVTQILPPGPRPEPESDTPGPFYVVIQAQTDANTIAQHPSVSVSGTWLLPQTEPQFIAKFNGSNTQALQFQLDTRRDKRNSGRAFSLDGTSLIASLNVKGALLLSPGGNYITVLAEGPDGIADPNIRFTVQAIYTPRTAFAFGLG